MPKREKTKFIRYETTIEIGVHLSSQLEAQYLADKIEKFLEKFGLQAEFLAIHGPLSFPEFPAPEQEKEEQKDAQ